MQLAQNRTQYKASFWDGPDDEPSDVEHWDEMRFDEELDFGDIDGFRITDDLDLYIENDGEDV